MKRIKITYSQLMEAINESGTPGDCDIFDNHDDIKNSNSTIFTKPEEIELGEFYDGDEDGEENANDISDKVTGDRLSSMLCPQTRYSTIRNGRNVR